MVKNKHGRVGVPRTRPTRAELKRNMYDHGFREAREQLEPMLREERDFMAGLLTMRNAGAIHTAIQQHLGL